MSTRLPAVCASCQNSGLQSSSDHPSPAARVPRTQPGQAVLLESSLPLRNVGAGASDIAADVAVRLADREQEHQSRSPGVLCPTNVVREPAVQAVVAPEAQYARVHLPSPDYAHNCSLFHTNEPLVSRVRVRIDAQKRRDFYSILGRGRPSWHSPTHPDGQRNSYLHGLLGVSMDVGH